jgi:hypothetical protein
MPPVVAVLLALSKKRPPPPAWRRLGRPAGDSTTSYTDPMCTFPW